MEGALASVVGGLVSVPVIAVPTSVGYGASFGGMIALEAARHLAAPPRALFLVASGRSGDCIAPHLRYFVEPVTGFLTIDSILSDEAGALRSTLSHRVLPMIVLGTHPLAIIARMTRSSMLEVLGEDYIRTARAKGLSKLRVIGLHAFRNALIPVVTVIGLQVGVLFTGAILTETIFSWPGVGKWMIEAINRRDYPVLQGGLLLLGTVVMAVNLLVDLAYGVINPRIRRS